MSRKKREYSNYKVEYPVLQGVLIDDAQAEETSTGRFKTSFCVKSLDTEKEYNCIYWSRLPDLKKDQLIIAKGFLKNEYFVCLSVMKIQAPYKFDTG